AQDEVEDDDVYEVYEVERVVAHRRYDHGLVYEIKWKDYDESFNTREPETNLFCDELVEEYWELYEEYGGRRTDRVGHEPPPNAVRYTSEDPIFPDALF
ncbi:hypothetical protein BGZ94_006390, partial [Podila epigama]